MLHTVSMVPNGLRRRRRGGCVDCDCIRCRWFPPAAWGHAALRQDGRSIRPLYHWKCRRLPQSPPAAEPAPSQREPRGALFCRYCIADLRCIAAASGDTALRQDCRFIRPLYHWKCRILPQSPPAAETAPALPALRVSRREPRGRLRAVVFDGASESFGLRTPSVSFADSSLKREPRGCDGFFRGVRDRRRCNRQNPML